eukprot:997159_1
MTTRGCARSENLRVTIQMKLQADSEEKKSDDPIGSCTAEWYKEAKKGKINEIRNECDAKCVAQDTMIAQNTMIAQKAQRMDEIQGKLKSVMSENDTLMQKMQENDNWSEKYQKLFATFTQHTDQNLTLKKKYDDQSQQLVVFKQQIHDLRQCKENLIGDVNRMRDTVHNGFKTTFEQLVARQTEIMRNKCIQMQNLQNEYSQSQQKHQQLIQNRDTEIAEWQSKYIENDAGYHQLKSGYDALENKYNEVMNAR